MPGLNKQKTIIGKLKSLVQRTSSNFFSKREPNITEDIARKIQKTDYEFHHKNEKSTSTQPYLIVADELQNEDDQIFRAAAFTLANMAVNDKHNAREIIAILEKSVQLNNKSEEQIQYLHEKIEKIKTKHKIEL